MTAPLIYTHADMTNAIEGVTTRVTDDVTHLLLAQIGTWLRRRACAESDAGEDMKSELLYELADDLHDGEWRRGTP